MGERTYITCLDLAAQTGVAHGLVGAAKPTLETWDLRGAETRPAKLVLLDQMLDRHIADYQPATIFYERPLPLRVLLAIGATEATVQAMRSFVAVTESAAARHGLRVGSWEVQVARRAVTGCGRYPRGEAKKHVMRFCKMIGHDPKNDNEADALVGYLFQSALLNPRWASVQGPLFTRAG